MASHDALLKKLQGWAASHSSIVGLVLVGSHACGAARPNSDVDIMVLTDEPVTFFRDRSWLAVFGQSAGCAEESWGKVRTLRVSFSDGPELEFNFVTPDWATKPHDGAKRVIEDGVRVLFDRTGELSTLSAAVEPGRIIVLGSERSGTSVVTEMVHLWGAHAGEPSKLTGSSEHSPHGQWEYEPLWELLAEIGDFRDGATWWDPAFEQRVRAKLDLPEMRRKARALMATMEGAGRPWVWKDPALCHFLSFWKPLWGEVTYVITVRHPGDVARSWQRYAVPEHLRDSVDLTACNLLRWQHMMLMVLRATNDAHWKIFVEFEALIRQPAVEAGRLAGFLDRQFGGVSDASRIAAMARAVDPSLWRNRLGGPLEELAESTVAQRDLYRLLRLRVRDSATEFVDDFPMPAGWWSFVHESEAVLRGGG